MKFWILPVVFLSLTSASAWAWSNHYLITAAALSNLPELNSEQSKVQSTPFEEMIKALGYADSMDFKTKMKIKKNYEFGFKTDKIADDVGEDPTVAHTPASILVRYCDEPDWGMDREVFDDYPDQWKKEYSYMGGKKGLESQAFRHMYWGPARWDVLASFKYPFITKPMGQAPDRAALFIDLARRAKEKGYAYWSIRFVANALHYLEDVSQPFHASQIQTLKFFEFLERKSVRGMGLRTSFTVKVKEMTNVVSYYHQSFEDYIGYVMKSEATSPEAGQFNEALAKNSIHTDKKIVDAIATGDAAILVKAMAGFSQSKADAAADASMAFFPSMAAYYELDDVKNQDALRLQQRKAEVMLNEFSPTRILHEDSWWKTTIDTGHQNSKIKEQYFDTVKTIFNQLGIVVRAVVQREVL